MVFLSCLLSCRNDELVGILQFIGVVNSKLDWKVDFPIWEENCLVGTDLKGGD